MVSTYEDAPELYRTTSFPDSLHESFPFFQDFTFPVRKTSSSDDIHRYYRYFELVQKNNGFFFTWKHYLEILREQLRSFDTLLIIGKSVIDRFTSSTSLETTSYSHETRNNQEYLIKNNNKFFVTVESECEITNNESCSETSSFHGKPSHKHRYVLLKKICSDLRCFTTKIHKVIERISTLTKKCPSCGNPLADYKHLKYCTEIIEDVGDTSVKLQEMCTKNIGALHIKPPEKLSSHQVVNVRAGGEARNCYKQVPIIPLSEDFYELP